MKLTEKIHQGCPNTNHCTKDNTKCCYLINHRCLIHETRKYKGGDDK